MTRHRLLRALRLAGAALAATVLLGAAAVYGASERRLRRVYDVPRAPAPVPPAAAADTARGRHLVTAVLVCVQCHTTDLGGSVIADGPVFHLAPPNLTRGRGGVGASRTDADLVRAIRHGVRPDGTPLLLMPSDIYAGLTDADLAAVVAYLRALPPVDRDVGPSYLGPLGRTLLAAGKLDDISAARIDHPAAARGAGAAPPPPDDTLAQGRYLAGVSGCAFCHTPSFAGRAEPIGPPGTPRPTDITRTGIGGWSEADFARAVRAGRRPDGRAISGFMPWRHYAGMTDGEVHALWAYVRSMPVKRGLGE